MKLSVPSDFSFLPAVCSHGFFMLAPNVWEPQRQALNTVITLDDDQAVPVRVTASPSGGIVLRSPRPLPAAVGKRVRSAVARMLRLNEDLSAFHRLCLQSSTHRAAAELRFGRLLGGASLFEDVVKVICTCNIGWRQTVGMIDRLVSLWGAPLIGDARPAATPGAPRRSSQRSAAEKDGSAPRRDGPARALAPRGFPTPLRLVRAGAAALRRQGRLGYRAAFVYRLAREVADGRRDLDALEHSNGPSDQLFRLLRDIRGVGDYAAAHLCMLLGRYDRLAIDTELLRHLRQQHPRRRWTPSAIRAHYEPWRPYQFLAYWFELWNGYTEQHGASQNWLPSVQGPVITRPT